MRNKKILPYIFLFGILIIALSIKNCKLVRNNIASKNESQVKESRGLNRNPAHINYSKHAKCRMECRHIDESEIKDILATGSINYKKSDLQNDDCHKRYAVEGYSKDRQHIRIIAAPCNSEITIITCIDLENEWQCNCGDSDAKKY
jgi:hypothetical protein